MPETAKPAPSAAPAVTPKRSGHRGQDVRDTVAEMAAKAHEISLEAGSKMAASMKEVVGAAAGLVAFSIESARDLVQYMVRRGQMTQDEADKLVRSAEDAWIKKHKGKLPPRPSALASVKPLSSLKSTPIASSTMVKSPAAPKSAVKPAAKPAAKKPVAKKATPKKPTAKKATKKVAKKAAKKAAKKPAAKKVAKKK